MAETRVQIPLELLQLFLCMTAEYYFVWVDAWVWLKGADCKSVANCFEGSNPSPPTWYDFNLYGVLVKLVKTPPFHGGNTGSNPVHTAQYKFNLYDIFGWLAQSGRAKDWKSLCFWFKSRTSHCILQKCWEFRVMFSGLPDVSGVILILHGVCFDFCWQQMQDAKVFSCSSAGRAHGC